MNQNGMTIYFSSLKNQSHSFFFKISFMKFSVLLSVYRKEQPSFFSESLSSVFAQTVPPTEVVLVKDGPLTVELEAVIARFTAAHQEIKVVPLSQNVGLGRALNEGLKHCQYELVARMDTDDICKPDRFEKQLKVFETQLQTDVCSSWIDEFEGDVSCVRSQRRLPEKHAQIMRYAKGRCPVNHPAVMYRKSKVLSVGGYQGFPEDSYLWVKLLLAGAVFYNIQESLLWFRYSSDVLKRRGGWRYACDDIRAQWNFYRSGFLSVPELVQNVLIRGTVRLMPNGLRVWTYKHLLRR